MAVWANNVGEGENSAVDVRAERARGRDLEKAGAGSSNSNGKELLTLAVTQQEAQQIILAQQTGQLYLGLLSDSSVTAPDGGDINVGLFKPTPIFVK